MLKDRRTYACIAAVDFERAKSWYRDKLGLTPVRDQPQGAFYQVGQGTGFLLYPTQFAGTARNTTMGFECDDVAAEVEALKQHGVVFEDYDLPELKTVDGIADFDGFKSAWFKDSEGNIIGLSNAMG